MINTDTAVVTPLDALAASSSKMTRAIMITMRANSAEIRSASGFS